MSESNYAQKHALLCLRLAAECNCKEQRGLRLVGYRTDAIRSPAAISVETFRVGLGVIRCDLNRGLKPSVPPYMSAIRRTRARSSGASRKPK